MKFYLTYFIRRLFKGSTFDVPSTTKERVIIPLKFARNWYYDIESYKPEDTNGKISKEALQGFSLGYISILIISSSCGGISMLA